LLRSPALRKLHLYDVFLTKRENKELLRLVQERCILESIVHFSWINYFSFYYQLSPWMADEIEFELVLNLIEITYTQMKFNRKFEDKYKYDL